MVVVPYFRPLLIVRLVLLPPLLGFFEFDVEVSPYVNVAPFSRSLEGPVQMRVFRGGRENRAVVVLAVYLALSTRGVGGGPGGVPFEEVFLSDH